jgi:hypothetical protein
MNLVMFDDEHEVAQHIIDAMEPATNAGQREKWLTNIDLIAAAKMYNVNIIICEELPRTVGGFRWNIYVPTITDRVIYFMKKFNEMIYLVNQSWT